MGVKQQTLDPTPSQIRQECRQIQDTWPEAERKKRAAWAAEAEVVIFPEAVDDYDAWRFEE